MKFWHEDTAEALARAISDNIAGSEIVSILDAIQQGIEGCAYAAEDFAERAEFEDKHDGEEAEDYREAQESFNVAAERLGEIWKALSKTEEEMESS